MKDLIIPVNNEALSRALVAVAGEAMAKTIVDAYKAIDAAMVFGYERSQAEEAEKRKEMAEGYVAALHSSEDRDTQEAFDNGYEQGFADGKEYVELLSDAEEHNVYNDGYVNGVSDARVWPSCADRRVRELCGEDQVADGINVKYFSDSGDYEFTGDDNFFANYGNEDSGDENDSDFLDRMAPFVS